MDKSAIDVSVLIAAWNAEAFVGKAIRSALDQRGVSVEVIVADDASTDSTMSVARASGDTRVRCLGTDRNGGPGAARNRALFAARGRWVAVLDADDAMAPDRLERLVGEGEENGAHVVVDNIVLTGSASGAGSGKTMFEPGTLRPGGELRLEEFILSNRPFKSRFNLGYLKPAFRRDFLVRHGIRYDESLRIGEDYVLLAEALAAGARCLTVPLPGYLYSVRDGSSSHRLRPAHLSAIRAADAAMLERRRFTGAALRAHLKRDRALRDAEAFLLAVEAIKDRDWRAAIAVLMRHPAAAPIFLLPLAARLRRALARRLTEESELPPPRFDAASKMEAERRRGGGRRRRPEAGQ